MASIKKQYLYLSILAILLLAFVFAIIIPLLSAIKQNYNQIVSQKEKLSSFQGKIGNFSKLNREYVDFQANTENISSLFVNPKEPLGFINFMENTAKNLGLSIDIISGGDKNTDSGFSALSFQVKLSGQFQGIMKFLEKMESADYLLRVDRLDMQKKPENELSVSEKKSSKTNYIAAALDISVFSKP